MYKSRDDEYLVDMQRVSGDTFEFIETVSRVLSDVRVGGCACRSTLCTAAERNTCCHTCDAVRPSAASLT
jgi:hypothetical protein